MNLIKLVFIFTLFALTSCATGEFHSYLEKPDQFNPSKRHYFSDHISIKNNELFNPGFSYFDINYTQTNKSKIWYIETRYRSSDWLFAESLRFIVDGKAYIFKSEPSPTRETGINSEVYVEEFNQFILNDEFINDLQKSKSASLRLEGPHYYQDKILEAADITNMIWFINYVKTMTPNKA